MVKAKKKIPVKHDIGKLNRVPKGDAGFNEASFNSNFSNEYLLQLQGREGSLTYQKMSKGDDIIGMILKVYKNPINSASWGIAKPEDITPAEEEAIDILNKWFFEIMNFNTKLSQILSFLEFGFSTFERIWVPVEIDGKMYILPDLQQRMQTSIENIYPDKGIVQQLTATNGTVDIPLKDLVFFILNQQGLDLRGTSLIRNAYPNWQRKGSYITRMNIGVQRAASGIPHMEIPEGTDPESKDYIATETLLKNITCQEDAYMITPKGFVFTIESYDVKVDQLQSVIDSLDEKNAISVLAQFILLGSGDKGGAYALSQDHSDLFLDGLVYIVNYIEQVLYNQVLLPAIKVNFGELLDSDKIRIKGHNLNRKAGAELAGVLKNLKDSGFISGTIDDEKQLRRNLELPPLSKEQLEEREANKAKIQNQIDNPVKDDGQSKDKKPVKLAESKTVQRKKTLDMETKQLKDLMKSNLLHIKDKLIADIRNMLNKGSVEIQGLKKIEVSHSRYAKNLERKIAGIANLGWNTAKDSAKQNKVKLSEPINLSKLSDKELRQWVINQSNVLAEDQIVTMKMKAIATASSSTLKGYSPNQAISNVDQVIDAFIEGQKVAVGASLTTVGALNYGEQEFYKEINDQLWGYTFIAVDDGNTTDICRWYSGKTFSIDSAEMTTAAPPLHPGCRSYYEPIYKQEIADKPKIENEVAPPSIQKQKSVY